MKYGIMICLPPNKKNMRQLSDKDLYQALSYAKNQDEESGRKILTVFQADQPALSHTLFSVFPSLIAKQNKAMAYLFMDLCFDVICVYQHVFGKLPNQQALGFDWLQQKALQLDADFKSIMGGKMNVSQLEKFQDVGTDNQRGLADFLYASVDEFVSGNPTDASAIRMTKMMVYSTIQLFEAVYDEASRLQSKTVH